MCPPIPLWEYSPWTKNVAYDSADGTFYVVYRHWDP